MSAHPAAREAQLVLPTWPPAVRIAIRCGVAVVVLLAAARLFFGVDYGDEPVYVAIPWRFLLGDRPFVDEVNPIQTAGFLTRPWIALWVGLTGGLEGVFLYLRFLWLLLTLGVAATVWAVLRRLLDNEIALIIAACAVAFVPLGLPTLSYNTLASSFFVIGIFTGTAAVLWPPGQRLFFAAGLSHALATVALPTYSVPALAFLTASLLIGRSRRRACLFAYAVGGLVGAAPFLPDLLDLSGETLRFAYIYTGGEEGWLQKLGVLGAEIPRLVHHATWTLACLAAFFVCAWRRWSTPALLAWILLPITLLQARANVNSVLELTLVALLAPAVVPFVWSVPWVRTTFFAVWLPGLTGGVIAAWTSQNGLPNAGFGILPAALITIAYASVFAARGSTPSSAWRALPRLLVPLEILSLLVLETRHVYIDDRIERLSARMDAGPAKGLFTTPEKKAWLDDLARSIAAVERPGARIAFTSHCSIGYLYTRMRPGSRTVWTVTCPPRKPWDCDALVREDCERFDDQGLIVFEMHRLMLRAGEFRQIPEGTVGALLRERMTPVFECADYTVFSSP